MKHDNSRKNLPIVELPKEMLNLFQTKKEGKALQAVEIGRRKG